MTDFIIPLVTPFTDDQSQVSEVRLARLVRHLLGRKARGFFVCGDVGEFASLTMAERKLVLEVTLREAAGTVPVWTHVTANTTMQATDLAQHALQHGVAGCVVMPPTYGSFSQTELKQHFRMVAKFGPQQVVMLDRGTLTDETKSELAQIGSVSFCEGPVDQFQLGQWASVPGLLLSESEAAKATSAMLEYGSARLAKAVLQYNDRDAGPPRSPMSLCSVDVCRELGL